MAGKTKQKASNDKPAFWARIDSRAKPGLGASKDAMRPVLTHGVIRHEKEGSFLYTTDSYVLVRLPIALETRTKGERRTLVQRRRLLPEALIPPETLKALDASSTGQFRIENGYLRLKEQSVLFPLTDEKAVGRPPEFKEIVGDLPDAGPVERIAFNAEFLRRISKALGAHQDMLRLRFAAPLRPIRVESPGSPEGTVAVLMPIRDIQEEDKSPVAKGNGHA